MTIEDERALKRIVAEGFKEAMADLGLYVDDRKEIRLDMAHLRKWRKAVDKAENSIRNSVIVTLVSGVAAILVLGFKDTILSWFK